MEHFLINSTFCLFILWLAYKLLLENTSWHSFKRWFLLGSIICSLSIPFIVVETIAIPIREIPFENYELVVDQTTMEESNFQLNWLYIIIATYIIGVLIMLWRFGKNLRSFEIQQEDEISSYQSYQLILRNQITIPHSFLTRIFISKNEHKANKVPIVILEHEKAHLDQKHSLDILFIEILIVLLWFNPLLYIIRYSIKLNHEFLADKTVLNQGVSTVEYQHLLLEHATASYQHAMANTFTFPIIKKRFQIMKTHTSNTSLILRSLALIPILALLIISCGKEETEFIEIEELVVEEQPINRKIIAVDPTDPKGQITINGKPHTYKINDDQINIYNENGELQDFESQGYEVILSVEEIEIIEVLESVTSKDIEEYNFQAKKHREFIEKNGQVVVFKEDTKRMQLIFNSMNAEQRAQNEPWPYLHWDNDLTPGDIPPPPAAPTKDSGYIKVDGKIYYYTLKEDDKAFYDRNGNKIDVTGKSVEYIKKEDLPPPPPPAEPLDYIKDKGDKMNYYIDDVKVNAAKAKAFIEKNGNKGVQIMPVNGVQSFKMYSKSYDGKVGINESIKENIDKSIKTPSGQGSIKEPADLSIRKAFLMVALRQQKPVKFEFNSNPVTFNQVQNLIQNNNKIPFDIITQNENEHTLSFYEDSDVKMSQETLSKMYSMFFQTVDPNKNKSSFIISKTNKKVGSISNPENNLQRIGDPIEIINVKKDGVIYYVNGKVANYKDALQMLTNNYNWNAYLDTTDSNQLMIINTYDTPYGPQVLSNNRQC